MFQTFSTSGNRGAVAGRMAALRKTLSEWGVDGFVIPRADAHQGEYVAPRDERLSYVTGFTGSAGAAVVFQDKAALFADGRYSLQAAEQTDTSLFDIVPIHQVTVAKWLETAAPAGSTIAYDPWLHGRADVNRMMRAAETANAKLIPLDKNPVDAIWGGQPPAPKAPIRLHPPALAGSLSAEKRADIAEEMTEKGITACVLTLPDSIAWLLNIRGSDIPRNPVPLVFAILLNDGRVTLFAEAEQIDDALAEHLGPAVERRNKAELPDALATLGGRRVLLDKTTCPVAIEQALVNAGGEIDWGEDPCVMRKAQKTDAEISGARTAHIRDGAAMARFLRWFDGRAPEGGLREMEIVQRLEEERRASNQLLDISFDTIAGSGPHGAIVHYRVSEASDRTLKPGELMLLDSGGQYQDGTTDITRTIWTGTPPDGALTAYTLVLKGMIALSTARFPEGTTGRDLDVLARAALWRAGLDYDHGTGHGVGSYLCVHEGPARIARGGDIALKPGMILSNEPGFYREGSFGVRIENLIVVTEAEIPEGGERPMLGFETLTYAPIDTRLIDRSLMSADEVRWLNGYHAEILIRVGPNLSGDDLAWLTGACAPI